LVEFNHKVHKEHKAFTMNFVVILFLILSLWMRRLILYLRLILQTLILLFLVAVFFFIRTFALIIQIFFSSFGFFVGSFYLLFNPLIYMMLIGARLPVFFSRFHRSGY